MGVREVGTRTAVNGTLLRMTASTSTSQYYYYYIYRFNTRKRVCICGLPAGNYDDCTSCFSIPWRILGVFLALLISSMVVSHALIDTVILSPDDDLLACDRGWISRPKYTILLGCST